MKQKEFKRQLIHMIFGITLLIGISSNFLSPLSIFLLIIISTLCSFLSKRIHVPLFSNFIDKFEREEIKKTFPGKGMIHFLIGSLLSIMLFEKNIALASIAILTFGDSISHIIGEKYGKLSNIFNLKSPKLFEGTLAGMIAGFLGALLFVPAIYALIGSFIGMVAEVIELEFNDKSLDDNIIVPLAAGTAMFLAQKYFLSLSLF